ncbi:MAG TPA: hypothetical protein VHY82_07070 [Acetobacteraceae bacterium]|nr:hypothetical protein [Acetobacteraceae bacterium]
MTTFLPSDWIERASGYMASVLLLAKCMGTMLGLRVIAIAGNVAFIFYAATTAIRPVLIFHSILLLVNIVRLVQIELARRTDAGLLDKSVTRRSGTRTPGTRSASRALA